MTESNKIRELEQTIRLQLAQIDALKRLIAIRNEKIRELTGHKTTLKGIT